MSLTLYFHPLASFCQKVLIALYENDTPFEPHLVDLGDATSSAGFKKLWPIGKMPVLRDEAGDRTIPESSIIIEYLAQHYPGRTRLVPEDPDLARQTRLRDRFYDLYVQEPMQKVVTDRLRPAGANDPFGVQQATTLLQTAYGMIDQEMATRTWAMGDEFGMADCAAAPALFYANLVQPYGDAHGNVARYVERLMQRPSFARVVEEARPYSGLFPQAR
jgi:glutathione S-transferase